MKAGKKTIICISVIALSLIMSAFAMTSGNGKGSDQPPQDGYLIREYEGKIAVFTTADDELIVLTDIEVKNLPSIDRESLQNGIFMQNSVELAQILEDFGS